MLAALPRICTSNCYFLHKKFIAKLVYFTGICLLSSGDCMSCSKNLSNRPYTQVTSICSKNRILHTAPLVTAAGGGLDNPVDWRSLRHYELPAVAGVSPYRAALLFFPVFTNLPGVAPSHTIFRTFPVGCSPASSPHLSLDCRHPQSRLLLLSSHCSSAD